MSTPGPWRAEGATVKAVSHGQWFKVCRADGLRHTPEGNEANARLIAAAPALLDALKEVMAELDAREPPQGSIYRDTGGMSLARAAIAKAEQ